MASSVGAFSRHATFPRRFPGHSPMAEVSRARMDFPSYPVDIVLPSYNHADTAHALLLLAIDRDFSTVHIEHDAPRRIDSFDPGD